MPVFARLVVLATLLAAPPVLAGAPPEARRGVSLPDVIAPLLPAVVSVTILKSAPPAPDGTLPKPIQDLGSGFIIDADGTIVTNRHVVADAEQITVTFADGRIVPATVLASNARPDLALLKVDVGHPLPTVSFGDSDALRIGETVMAVGNPLGLSTSVSVGVVSALNRDINETAIDDYVQTDAAINHGNSGGPLFNLKGEVVGVSWALVAPGENGSIGLGLAIPSNDVAFVVGQMRHFGRLQAGFIGARLQQLTAELAAVLGLPDTSGGIVTVVQPESPAAKAGMQVGDVILAFDGRRPRDVRALLRLTGAAAPGSEVAVRLWRNAEEIDATIAVAAWTLPALDPAGGPVLLARTIPTPPPRQPLSLVDITKSARAAHHVPDDVTGALVDRVALDSPQSYAGITVGDVVLRIGAAIVASAPEAQTKLAEAHGKGFHVIPVLVQTGERAHWVVLPLG